MVTTGRCFIQISHGIEANLAETNYDIVVHDVILVKTRIQSMHMNRTRYYVYVLIECDDEAQVIPEYYCSCKNGYHTGVVCT